MSKTWKWIIGIVIGLVVLAGVSFVAANYYGFGHMAYFGRTAYYGHPMMDDYGFGNRAPMEGFHNFRQPMMGGRRFGGYGFMSLPFLFVGGFLRLVFPLGLLALVAYFSYRAGKKAGMKSALPAPEPEPVMDTKPEETPKKRGRKVA